MITIQWLGHSCMKVNWDGYTVVFDPFADGYVEGYRNIRETANLVLCSHGHGDHNAADLVRIEESKKEAPFEVVAVESYHDDAKGTKRGKNTIYMLRGGGKKLVHMGDIGCPLTPEQYELLRGADAVMVPVGGYFTAEPAVIFQMMKEMEAKVVIPMHYRRGKSGFAVLGTLDAYTALCDHVVEYPGDTIELTDTMEPQTAVLTYL